MNCRIKLKRFPVDTHSEAVLPWPAEKQLWTVRTEVCSVELLLEKEKMESSHGRPHGATYE